MPTRYWLVGDPERMRGRAAWRPPAACGAAEAAVDADALADAHARYAAERDAAIPADHAGPRPTGGVGGTRVGVKCLHAHYAWHLAGGDDPVGRWVADQLGARARRLAVSVAAIDCGTNSTRLLVADDGTAHGRAAHAHHPPRPGRRRHRAGLAPEADRAHARRAARVPRGDGPPRRRRVRMTATSAARDAANRDEFFDAAEAVVGVRPSC